MTVDLGKKEEEIKGLFEKLGVIDLEEQIKITEELEKNPQKVERQEKTQDVGTEMDRE